MSDFLRSKHTFVLIIAKEEQKQAILIALGDEEMLKILDVTMLRARSVGEIMLEAEIPHTTTYRKVKWLLDQGLLAVERIVITPDGKKSSLVRSVLRSFNVRYERNSVVVEGEKNFNPVERTVADFFSLNSP